MTNMQVLGSSTTDAIYIRNDSYTTAAAFKAAMSGVYLFYELSSPIDITFEPKSNCIAVDNGTVRVLPENGESPTTAPCSVVAKGPIDASVLTSLETTIANLATAINKTATKNADGSYSFS